MIIMVAGSVLGNMLYAIAGLMHSKMVILLARTMVGICQCQLAGPIYIAWTVGVKRRTKVLFMYATMTAVALFSAPLIASLLEIFVKELRIDDLVLDSDTIPGWFMALLYFIYMLLLFFFFEDACDPQDNSPSETSRSEKMWTPGFVTCLFGSFLAPTTTTMCVVFFVKLAENSWHLSVSTTGFYLAALLALVAFVSLASSTLTPYLEDRKGFFIGSLGSCLSAFLTFQWSHEWESASITVFILGFLLLQCFFGLVKGYTYTLVPKIVAPHFKDRAALANMVVIQLGRGLGAQLGAMMNITAFAASQVASYLVLAVLVSVSFNHLKQHAKAM